MSRIDALYRVDTAIISMQREEIRNLRDEPSRLIRGLITGKVLILGKPARIIWPDGTPCGLEGEQLLAMFP